MPSSSFPLWAFAYDAYDSGAPAAGSQVDATWNVTRELFFFMLWSVVMYSCQVLNKLASGALRVSLGLQIRRTLLPILHNRGEERAVRARLALAHLLTCAGVCDWTTVPDTGRALRQLAQERRCVVAQ